MTKYLSLLHDRSTPGVGQNYESTVSLPSRSMAGVTYRIVRLSFGRRMELARRVLELARRYEYHEAGERMEDNIDAHILSCEIDRLYLQWGLAGIEGLTVDGMAITPEVLVERGPEPLAREIVEAIKRECGLGEHERKN